MPLSTGRVRFRTRSCSSTASRARIRDGGLRLTTQAGGPTTTGTQILSSTCPRGPVELVGVRCVCMLGKAKQLSVMLVTVAQAASANHTMAGERGVQARHGQFRMMCSCEIVRDPDVSRALSHTSNNGGGCVWKVNSIHKLEGCGGRSRDTGAVRGRARVCGHVHRHLSSNCGHSSRFDNTGGAETARGA